MPNPNENRLAIVRIPQSQVWHFLFDMPVEGKSVVKRTRFRMDLDGDDVDLRDCELVSTYIDFEREEMLFKLRSPRFNFVRPGDPIPNLDWAIEETQHDLPTRLSTSDAFQVGDLLVINGEEHSVIGVQPDGVDLSGVQPWLGQAVTSPQIEAATGRTHGRPGPYVHLLRAGLTSYWCGRDCAVGVNGSMDERDATCPTCLARRIEQRQRIERLMEDRIRGVPSRLLPEQNSPPRQISPTVGPIHGLSSGGVTWCGINRNNQNGVLPPGAYTETDSEISCEACLGRIILHHRRFGRCDYCGHNLPAHDDDCPHEGDSVAVQTPRLTSADGFVNIRRPQT